MFTGIVEEIGLIQSARNSGKGKVLVVRAARKFLSDVRIDDSISVSGTCLTVIRKTSTTFVVEAVEETLKKTTTGSLRVGSKVNLEKAIKLSDRLGGHLVLGHVDTVGTIINITPQTLSWMFEVEFPLEYMKYVIPVGSIAFDGISLTVAERRASSVVVAIIPHTMEKTIFGIKKKGDHVNIEFDLIGKYIEQFLRK
ncbi:MAG: riboflavin synthase [Bacteroidota bacterium]